MADDRPTNDTPTDNPIMDFARALRDAPTIADAPFTLTPPAAKAPRAQQPELFDTTGKDDRR